MLLIVDRIAGGFAVCEDEKLGIRNIPLEELPPGIREGSVLRARDGVFTLDAAEETKRRKQNFELFKSLEKKDNINP